ncbi:hypothetical protein HK098_004724 [Nowakowskiella sp. JEL0407]|nr:hypothetical protein HK098_004724 [Nowakowskiella sp. JEL0407]
MGTLGICVKRCIAKSSVAAPLALKSSLSAIRSFSSVPSVSQSTPSSFISSSAFSTVPASLSSNPSTIISQTSTTSSISIGRFTARGVFVFTWGVDDDTSSSRNMNNTAPNRTGSKSPTFTKPTTLQHNGSFIHAVPQYYEYNSTSPHNARIVIPAIEPTFQTMSLDRNVRSAHSEKQFYASVSDVEFEFIKSRISVDSTSCSISSFNLIPDQFDTQEQQKRATMYKDAELSKQTRKPWWNRTHNYDADVKRETPWEKLALNLRGLFSLKKNEPGRFGKKKKSFVEVENESYSDEYDRNPKRKQEVYTFAKMVLDDYQDRRLHERSLESVTTMAAPPTVLTNVANMQYYSNESITLVGSTNELESGREELDENSVLHPRVFSRNENGDLVSRRLSIDRFEIPREHKESPQILNMNLDASTLAGRPRAESDSSLSSNSTSHSWYLNDEKDASINYSGHLSHGRQDSERAVEINGNELPQRRILRAKRSITNATASLFRNNLSASSSSNFTTHAPALSNETGVKGIAKTDISDAILVNNMSTPRTPRRSTRPPSFPVASSQSNLIERTSPKKESLASLTPSCKILKRDENEPWRVPVGKRISWSLPNEEERGIPKSEPVRLNRNGGNTQTYDDLTIYNIYAKYPTSSGYCVISQGNVQIQAR